MRSSKKAGLLEIGICWIVAFVAIQFVAPIPQDLSYHKFAETGSWWGVENFWNVFTNLAFVLPGIWGAWRISQQRSISSSIPEFTFFVGFILTGLGSAYYHLAPDNPSLVWDRLPMTIAFMAFFISMLGHCLDRKLALKFLPLALFIGATSVIYWAYQEANGIGDLRYYGVVQFLPMLLIPIMLLRWPPMDLDRKWLWLMLLLYFAAKVCEYFDVGMAEVLPLHFTGHAVKHLLAGAAGLAFAKALPAS